LANLAHLSQGDVALLILSENFTCEDAWRGLRTISAA
jgi:hypothetical protein